MSIEPKHVAAKPTQKIIAIIPARGGSKGVIRKNIRLLGGKPLIAWTIEVAKTCPLLDRIIVSTEDKEIAAIAQHYGAEVPFVRPLELAQDETPDLPVFLHAFSWLAEHQDYHPEIVTWLRPTTPLRIAQDISQAVNLLITSGADSVRSVCPVEHHPYWMKQQDDNGRLHPFIEGTDDSRYYRRQLLPTVYRLNGVVDVSRTTTVLHKKALYTDNVQGYVMPTERSIDLDTELDFALTEILLNRTIV